VRPFVLPARLVSLALVLALSIACAAPARAASRDVKVLVPDADNLQYMSFWLAKGAGFFAEEGLEITIVVPPTPQETRGYFERGEANVAVLPPPVYLELVAAKFPLLLVANLLKNDPINLVVSGRVWTERKLSRDVPVRERLLAIKGLRVGVAPHPPARLRAMYAAYGMDADHDIEMRIIQGKGQNDAFGRGDVDALFAHTPYLEKALVDQGAQMLVHVSGGEVPVLADRQIHALVFTRAFAEASPATALAMVRAIAKAEALVHSDLGAATAALGRELPAIEPRQLRTIVELYAPAIPITPEVRADGFTAALLFFPSGRPTPSLAGIDTSAYVAPDLARAATAPPKPRARWFAIAAAAAALLFLFVLRRRARRAQV
jgi:NitT/TauT family transport system substrate-binding protein